MSKDNEAPAFPVTEYNYQYKGAPGITIRDYFAAKAMQGFLADSDTLTRFKDDASALAGVSEASYRFADAMLEERAKL